MRINIAEIRTIRTRTRSSYDIFFISLFYIILSFHIRSRFWTKKRRRIAVAIFGSIVAGILLAIAVLIPLFLDENKSKYSYI